MEMEQREKVEDQIASQNENIMELEARIDGLEKELSVLKSARMKDSELLTEMLGDINFLSQHMSSSHNEVMAKLDRSRWPKYETLANKLLELVKNGNTVLVYDFRKKHGLTKQGGTLVIRAAKRLDPDIVVMRDNLDRRRFVIVKGS